MGRSGDMTEPPSEKAETMFNVIDGAKREMETTSYAADVCDKAEETGEERKPYDWSNVVFAAQYCERARAKYEERLVS